MRVVTVAGQRVLTVGHGTLPEDALGDLLERAGVRRLIDVRRFPGSRRHPHTARGALAVWLPEREIGYRWAEELGGRRRPAADSPNDGLRNAAFRGYADHMGTAEFRAAAERLAVEAGATTTAVLCSESPWWRCHRRLLADHLTLVAGLEVHHLAHDGGLTAHGLTETAHREGDVVRYHSTSKLV